MEINARFALQSIHCTAINLIPRISDARSGQVVDDRIRPTLEAGSTVGSSKPVLLIIDEIDGATGGDNVLEFT